MVGSTFFPQLFASHIFPDSADIALTGRAGHTGECHKSCNSGNQLLHVGWNDRGSGKGVHVCLSSTSPHWASGCSSRCSRAVLLFDRWCQIRLAHWAVHRARWRATAVIDHCSKRVEQSVTWWTGKSMSSWLFWLNFYNLGCKELRQLLNKVWAPLRITGCKAFQACCMYDKHVSTCTHKT